MIADEIKLCGLKLQTAKPEATKKKWPHKTGDLLKEVQLIFSMIGQERITLV
jgi:hypothetical protein